MVFEEVGKKGSYKSAYKAKVEVAIIWSQVVERVGRGRVYKSAEI